jgi:hypothetical protein
MDVLTIRKRHSWHQNLQKSHPQFPLYQFNWEPSQKALTIYQKNWNLFKVICNLWHDLQLNSYSRGYIDSFTNPKGNSPSKMKRPIGLSVYLTWEKCFTKFKLIGYLYNIRTIFKSEHTVPKHVFALRTKIQTFSRKQDVNIQMHIKADLDVWNSTMGMC